MSSVVRDEQYLCHLIAGQCVLRENWFLYLSSSLVTINTVKARLYKEDTKKSLTRAETRR